MEELRFFRKWIFIIGLLFGLSIQLRAEPISFNCDNAYESIMNICIQDNLKLLSYKYIQKLDKYEDFKGYVLSDTEKEIVIIFTDEDDIAIETTWEKL